MSTAGRLGALTYLVTQGVLLLWWVAFYPGLMSYDSIMYIWQATTSNWSTSHSVAYNGLLWISLQLTGEISLLTAAQTVAMAAGLAYAVVGLRRLRVPGRWLAIAAIAVVCVPYIGTFTTYVSKDTAFVICQVWLTGTVARIVAALLASRRLANHEPMTGTASKEPTAALIGVMFVEFALMALFRPNGFVVILLATAGLVAALAGVRWRVAASGIAAVAIGVAANFLLYPALGVRSAGSELLLGPAYADLAVAYAERPSVFSRADRALLAKVAPLEFWRDSANCYDSDETVSPGRPEFSIPAARDRKSVV